MTLRIASPAAVCLALVIATAVVPASAAPARPFRFESAEFWLNLHAFLYVLGRAEDRYPDAQRPAVAAAPADSERGSMSLTDAERSIWADAVGAYAKGLSRRDPTRDRPLAELEARLADRDDARSLDGAQIDESLRAVLERAAPVYRKAWWAAHRASNREWVAATQKLVGKHGQTALEFVTRAYAMPWPARGYRVHIVKYADWAGAYSAYGDLLLVSSNPAAGLTGYGALETVFHESMHNWDDAMAMLLDAQARAAGVQVPPQLSHAIVIFTAGEAIRRAVPAGYVSVAESMGVWQRGMTSLKAAVEDAWLPYLNGAGTRDDALAALVRRAAVTTSTQGASSQPSRTSSLFTFSTDDFWLNLHHFLYAAGVIEAKLPDASQPALAPAAPDVQRGTQRLDVEQRRQWAEIVTKYAKEWSLKLPGTDPNTVRALADAGDAPTLTGARIPPALLAVLEEAAPLYRAGWWTTHRDGNRAWQSQIEPLIARYGDDVGGFIARAYATDWPASGRRIYVTSYANFGGAYSLVNGGVIVVSSVDPNSQGLSGLEAIFHESTHQWDPQTFTAFSEQARKINVLVPRDLTHAMIFFTAGQAVRRIAPEYVPTVDRLAIWDLKLSGSSLPASRLKQPLLDAWKPYLDGRGTREEALASLVAKAAAASTNAAH